MKGKGKFLAGMVLTSVILLGICICAEGKVRPKSMGCAAKVSFEMETNKVELTVFKCYIKPFTGKDVLWYEFGLKNVSDKPARFLIRIIPEDGPAFSGLIPRAGKPKDFPVLAPGEEKVDKYPMNTLMQVPPSLTVVVEEIVQ